MVKIFHTCVDDALKHLTVVQNHPRLFSKIYNPPRNPHVEFYQASLRAFRMLIWCIPDCDVDLLADLNGFATSLAQLYKFEAGADIFALTDDYEYCVTFLNLDRVRKNCHAKCGNVLYSLPGSFEGEPFTSNETVEFLDCIHAILNDVLQHKNISHIPNLDGRIESLVERVFLIRNLVYYTSLDIFEYIGGWAYEVASFTLFCWFTHIEETWSRIFIYHLERFDPCYGGYIKLCFEVIKRSKMKRREDRLVFGEFVSRFVDFFLENLRLVLNDDFPLVRQGLIFFVTFLADPPVNVNRSELIMASIREQIHPVLDQASNNMCFYCGSGPSGTSRNTTLDDLLKSIDEVRGHIVKLYIHIPPCSWSDFPRIDKLGYFDGLLSYLENLEEMMNRDSKVVPCFKHQIIEIQVELLPLRLSLSLSPMMQNEDIIGVKDVWEEIMSVLYEADFAIKSSFFIDHPIWYNMTCLSSVVRKIKDIRYNVNNIQSRIQTKTEAILPALMSCNQISKSSTSTTKNLSFRGGFLW